MAIKKYTNGSWVSASYRKYGTETDTIATLPATVIGDGTPISSYTIKGNMEQSGTPTPSNPIYPSGCGVRTENLFNFDESAQGDGYAANAIMVAGGTLNTNDFFISEYIPVIPGQSYIYFTDLFRSGQGVIKFYNITNGTVTYLAQTPQKKVLSRVSYSTSECATFTVPTGTSPVITHMRISVDKESTMFFIVKGSTAPASYIPYGYKLPITLGNTTTDIYLGEVQTTRRIKKLVLTGEEGWLISSSWKGTTTSVFYFNDYTVYTGEYNVRIVYSDRSLASTRDELYNGDSDMIARTGTNSITFRVSDSIATTLTGWTQYLAQQYANGAPVTIWYVLATPTTGIVNEPIRKIGDYVDSVLGTNLATSGTVQELDVDTTLKPSEVDLTYHGWHKHDDTKYST